MEPLPKRMRERIIVLYESGVPTKRIAEGMGISRSGSRRVRQRLRERGTLEPKVSRPGFDSGLTVETGKRLREAVAAGPGSTRQQIKDELGLGVDVRTIGRWLAKLGLVLKKSRSVPPSRTGRT